MPSQRTGKGCEAFLEGWEGLGGPPGGPGGVVKPFRRARGVRSCSQRAWRGREVLKEGWKGCEALLEGRYGS